MLPIFRDATTAPDPSRPSGVTDATRPSGASGSPDETTAPDLGVRLGEFLKARRARVRPEDVGLPDGGRRRVPGLRREELAQIAGVSVDYYVRLEQGRAAHPSADVLDALARALGLDDVERRHLHDLAPPEQARRRGAPRRERVRPAVQQLLERLHDLPAFVVDRRMDMLAWNRLAAALLCDFGALPDEHRNAARWMFLDDTARERHVDWERCARENVGVLRRAAGLQPDDPRLAALIGELSMKSPHFTRWWASHDVHERTHGVKRYRHPVVGRLDVNFETLALPADPGQSLIVYTPEPGSESETALRLLAAWAAE